MPVEMLIKALPNLGYQKFFDSAHSTKIIQDNVRAPANPQLARVYSTS